jgi:hypothetical protein
LEKEYKRLSNRGQLLQFAIRKDKVRDFVVPAAGPVAEVEIDGKMQKTNDALLILDTLKKNPEKVITPASFLIAVTSRLKNSDGVKCRALNAVNPKLWAEYEEKEQALRRDIKQYLKMEK